MYVCSLYLCVHCFSVYRYVYSCACSFLCACNVLPWRAFVLCNLCSRLQHCSIFPSKTVFCFLPYLLPFLAFLLCVPHLRPFLLPFCRSFVFKRLQRSFQTVFKRFLSVHLCGAYICTVCTISCAYIALFAANLPFCGVGGGTTP